MTTVKVKHRPFDQGQRNTMFLPPRSRCRQGISNTDFELIQHTYQPCRKLLHRRREIYRKREILLERKPLQW